MKHLALTALLAMMLQSCIPEHPPGYGAIALGLDVQKLALATDQSPISEGQVPLTAGVSDIAVVQIGGFMGWLRGFSRQMFDQLPALTSSPELRPHYPKELRAYYYWDGGEGNIFSHSTERIVQDINAWRKRNPKSPLVLIGHSYGGSATMDIARKLANQAGGKIIIATLDPVSRRASSQPKKRAEGVNYWVNVYITHRRSFAELVPLSGGLWKHCPEADINLSFSGKEADFSRKHRHRHCFPLPMFVERTVAQRPSAAIEYLRAKLLQLAHENKS